MIYLAEMVLILPVNIAMAWWHARLIRQNRPIRHGAWSAIFFLLVGVTAWWRWPALRNVGTATVFAVACACGRQIVFNISLNFFRGLAWDYSSHTSTSIIDRIERRLFGARMWMAEAVALIVFIILQFFI